MPRIRHCVFFYHTCGEIHQLSRIQTLMFTMVSASWAIRRMHTLAGVVDHSPALYNTQSSSLYNTPLYNTQSSSLYNTPLYNTQSSSLY